MQPNHQFVENLIALRKHYQALLLEHERSWATARQQLTHINALLVDQLVQQPNFIDSLIGLRGQYQARLEEYSRSSTHVREQLTHVNALLVDQLVLPDRKQPVSIQASTVKSLQPNHPLLGVSSKEAVGKEKQSITPSLNDERSRQPHVNENKTPACKEAADVATDSSPYELNSVDSPVLGNSEQGTLSRGASDELDSVDSLDELNTQDDQIETDEPSHSSPTPIEMVSSELDQSIPDEETVSRPSHFPPTKTEMLPKYRQLTKLQAVKTLLQENAGSILHVDYIIRALYGELDTDAIRSEKPRMYDTLSKGTSKGLWDKVPDQASCYTIDLNLVNPELASKKTIQQSKARFRRRPQSPGRSSNKMLPPYQQLNLVDAIEAIVREHPGEILNIDTVARALYGELSGLSLSKAKERVGKALWSGAKQNRWQRIPDQTGSYTLALELLDQN